MSETRSTKRPAGAVIFGWVAVFFCGLLSLLNAALATELGFRVLFIVCGVVLVAGGIILVSRWYRKARS
jgi:hypothetical protein